ncbi:MAG TPA: hypothetical protein DDY98_06690 [Ruminococcaceae bacterium]|nr:hypothetical protein [Oscillospiraceae bacterium]
MERLTVITGHYGSGKTTFALNSACRLAAQGKAVTIVDLDIVNPYFRTEDHRAMLESKGITVISPPYANTNLDLPGLSSQIYGAFEQKGAVILDVGGDDAGATALGRFNRQIEQRGYEMLCVVNARRNLTAEPMQAAQMLWDIEQASRLKATALVNNTHLKQFTEPKTVLDSLPFAQEVSRLTGLPIRYTTAPSELAPLLSEVENLYPVEPFVKTPWEA